MKTESDLGYLLHFGGLVKTQVLNNDYQIGGFIFLSIREEQLSIHQLSGLDRLIRYLLPVVASALEPNTKEMFKVLISVRGRAPGLARP